MRLCYIIPKVSILYGTKEGLHLGNKLRFQHIEYVKKKMNVKLAAQVLSESVARSLQFCLDNKLVQFIGCEATIKFIEIFNNLFDILNSRSLFAKGYKRPMREENILAVKDFLKTAENYIKQIKLADGKLVVNSNRKTGFQGFLVCIHSLITMYDTLIGCSERQLNFLMSYKMSQDHIELFFGKIRSMGGCNNNPTSRQFSSAYKKILVHNDIQDVVKGNCIPLDSVPILSNSGRTSTNSVMAINDSSARNRIYSDEICENEYNEDNYIYIPSTYQLSLCSNSIVAYIGGFVVHKLKKSLRCESCIEALSDDNDRSMVHNLITIKSKGNLIHPSNDVIEICQCCEKMFRKSVSFYGNRDLSLGRKDFRKIIYSVLKYFSGKNIFSKLSEHMYDNEPLNNHLILLVKAICENYLQVRYSYAAKHFSSSLVHHNKMKSRQTYTKLILFSGQ